VIESRYAAPAFEVGSPPFVAETTMADPSNVPSEPAYAAAPRRSGLLYAIAGIVALAAAAALAIFMLGGKPSAPPAGPADVRGSAEQKSLDAKATLDAASKSVMNPAPATSPVAEPPPAVVAAGTTAAPPPMTAGEAPRAAAPAPAVRPAPAATPAPSPAPKAAASAPKSAAPPVVAPAAPAAAPAPPAQVASADRWSQMRDEMGRCSSSSVIPRIQCERRIRASYCEGYWGSVPDCPTGNKRS
jgi:hypothetical protein